MPTILRTGAYRFYFYSNEGDEPPHVHVDGNGHSAKFWLLPVVLARNVGFRTKDLNDLWDTLNDKQQDFLEAWNDYFGNNEG